MSVSWWSSIECWLIIQYTLLAPFSLTSPQHAQWGCFSTNTFPARAKHTTRQFRVNISNTQKEIPESLTNPRQVRQITTRTSTWCSSQSSPAKRGLQVCARQTQTADHPTPQYERMAGGTVAHSASSRVWSMTGRYHSLTWQRKRWVIIMGEVRRVWDFYSQLIVL